MKLDTVKKLNHFPLSIFFIVIFLLGLLFLFLDFTFVVPSSKNNGVEVEATITKITIYGDVGPDDSETSYEVLVKYTYEGVEYTDISNPGYDSSMKEGKVITVLIDPENPGEIMGDGSFGLIFGIISGVFTVVGLAGAVYNIKKLVDMKKRREE